MNTDEAVEIVARELHERRPEWPLEQTRLLAERARGTIGTDPDRFLEVFLDDLANLPNGPPAKQAAETLNPVPVCATCHRDTRRVQTTAGKGVYKCVNPDCAEYLKTPYRRGSRKPA